MQEQFKGRTSFSQEGEDVLLERILGDIDYNGSFVDIGAHHPVRFSNTYKFYQAGWRGINIEATPGSSKIFNEVRPLDINVEIPVSDKEEELTFYVFNNPELNTFSEEHALHWHGRGDNKIIDRVKLKTATIDSILKEHGQQKKNFDFLSIDVEGLDLRILKTLDFNEYSFNFIIVEDSTEMSDINDGELHEFLVSKGYKLLSKLFYSSIYYLDYSSKDGKRIFDQLGMNIPPELLNRSPYVSRMIQSAGEIKGLVPQNESFIFIDANQLQVSGEFAGRAAIPFLEKNGLYWGPPADDATAIQEIQRQQKKGVAFIIFAWPGFWLFDYYKGMHDYIRSNSRCLLQNDRIIIFNFIKAE
ncbi:FkbM family methyltransferase [Segetibacter koreensis]|uniref:FkbM family methyltransferase n=1 Tax=Segetibacter koreensis TaxID=398037 RepID=UPI00037CC603|nr:FkbM family methyltransferase [Segetibacter koreensis]